MSIYDIDSARIIPAYAGNTTDVLGGVRVDGDHPRVCGEHFSEASRDMRDVGSSPRMRGTLQQTATDAAHAGNTPMASLCWLTGWDHPRVCGEHGYFVLMMKPNLGSSPRMRGTPERRFSTGGNMGIIPAYAGNTDCQRSPLARPRDHPRVCGEHDMMVINSLEDLGSSPRMRGTLRQTDLPSGHVGIIPAYAGNTSLMGFTAPCPRDHPRVCGEHLYPTIFDDSIMGSSPRMRGTLTS